MALIFPFKFIFFSIGSCPVTIFSLFCMIILKLCVRAFSGRLDIDRVLELGIHIDDELWYSVTDDQAHCSCSSLYLSIFLSFLDKFG